MFPFFIFNILLAFADKAAVRIQEHKAEHRKTSHGA